MILQHPYARLMRLHQPIGILLLFWPCAWSLTLNSHQVFPVTQLIAFALGAVLMRSAGCIINDLWDRKIDAEVERTRTRPLASGELNPRQALQLLAALLAVSLGVALFLGLKVVFWAAASLPLVAAYPLMKRITWWPQAFLGLTFNWGAFLGSVAGAGEVTQAGFLLYLGGIGWTLGYDTVYAHQDKSDDARIGVKSTALRLGDSKNFLWFFYGWAVFNFAAAGVMAYAGALYFAGLGFMVTHLMLQVAGVDLQDPASCRRVFRSNGWAGLILFMACLLQKMA